MGLDNKEITVELNDRYFKEIVYWCVCKYMMDDYKREQSSSKQSLLGGFIDRWLNTAPEFLIFDELLCEEDYTVITDSFIYSSSKAKNAPDIIGLIDKEGNRYPFAKFYDNEWKICKNAPFIEMKTFRHNQNLVTIPCNQFDEDHYYTIVESHIEKDYLTNLFKDDFFEKKDLDTNFSKDCATFIESNENNIIKQPKKLIKNDKIGYYDLIGVYKGDSLKKIEYKIVEKDDKPFYFLNITPSPPSLTKPRELSGDFYINDPEKHIFCEIEFHEDSKLTLVNEIKNAIDVYVEGKVEIDEYSLEEGFYRLSFKKINRKSLDYMIKNVEKSQISLTKPEELPSGYFYFEDSEKDIPCVIEFHEDSKLTLVKKNQRDMDVYVKGKVEIDDITLEEGLHRLIFNNFSKTGDKKEMVFTKSFLRKYNKEISSQDDLISHFDKFIKYSD